MLVVSNRGNYNLMILALVLFLVLAAALLLVLSPAPGARMEGRTVRRADSAQAPDTVGDNASPPGPANILPTPGF